MQRLTKFLLAGAAITGAALMASPNANATVITGWDFDLSAAGSGTFSGLGTATGVKQLNFDSGSATILQSVSGGSALGQSFTETGVIKIVSYTPQVGASNPLPLGTAADAFFQYSLSGFVDGTGGLHFTGGTADLYLESDNDLNPATGTSQHLALFNVQPGTGGTALVSAGGIPSGTIALNFKEDPSSPVTGLFVYNGNPIDDLALELANIQPVLDPTVNPNPNTSGIDPKTGNGTEVVTVTEEGQLLLSVPEPASMAIFGAGLFGFGILSRRRAKKQA